MNFTRQGHIMQDKMIGLGSNRKTETPAEASENLPCCSVMGVGHSETGEGGDGGDEKHFEKYSFLFSAFS